MLHYYCIILQLFIAMATNVSDNMTAKVTVLVNLLEMRGRPRATSLTKSHRPGIYELGIKPIASIAKEN